MTRLCIHSKKTRRKREWHHKSRENRKILHCNIGIKIKKTLKGIFHGLNIFFNYLNFGKNLIKLVFKIFKIIFNFLIKSSFHIILCLAKHRNLRLHHMLKCNDVSFFDHECTNCARRLR